MMRMRFTQTANAKRKAKPKCQTRNRKISESKPETPYSTHIMVNRDM